jgi:pilus assembly protein Flp/PilA
MIRKFYQDVSGTTAVEYGLLVFFIALVVVAGIGALGTAVTGLFTTGGNALK